MPPRKKSPASGPASRGPAGPSDGPESQPELIVVLHPEATVSVQGGQVVPLDHPSQDLLAPIVDAPPDTVDAARARLRPLFSSNPERLPTVAAPAANQQTFAPLAQYFTVDGLVGGQEQLLDQFLSIDHVVGAYLKPPAALPVVRTQPPSVNEMLPRAEEPPVVTADFTSRQGYLDRAPGGVDARWAWTQPGGQGEGVNVIDVEGAWRLSHEDLLPRRIGVTAGTPSDVISWRNHGTAVVGVIASEPNGFGTTGIAPKAAVSVVPIFGTGMGSSAAIKLAADALTPGDILLIELHRPGPQAGAVGQRGYIPVEWWPDDFDAIVYAVSRSILVVEAGGNGSQNLDDPVYDTPQAGFPPSWSNPFRRGQRDSGAIMVGAGAPPPGTHGTSSWGPDRSRLDFSNFGALIDVQAWGREVTSCGYGDLQGGTGSEDYWYTDQFSGTSSASPIVTGSLACVQGILRRAGDRPLTPQTARQLLRETGSPQTDGPQGDTSQRIGNRPDIPALVARARSGGAGKGLQKEQKEQKESEQKLQKDQKEQEGGGKSFTKLEKNEFKDMLETGRPRPVGPNDASGVEARLTALEGTVAELKHFISAEQRPDLSVLARADPAATTRHSDGDSGTGQ